MPPLQGIRVLDLTQVVSGPYCSTLLGDFGADVIKVEPPTGDELRGWSKGHKGLSGDFTSTNRNKRSVILDLKKAEAKDILLKLVKSCDIFLENYRPGAMDRLGLGFNTISSINPRIIYCSISGFGQDGPYRDRAAYDMVIQGMGGLIAITGDPSGPPSRVGLGVCDLIGALFSTIAILAALETRRRTDRGLRLDISLLDATVAVLSYVAGRFFATGKNPERTGLRHNVATAPYQGFKTKDGNYIIVAAHNDRLWKTLCDLISKPELLTDQRFLSMVERQRNKDALAQILEPLFESADRDEWIKKLLDAGIPCGPIYTFKEIFEDPHVLHRKMILEMQQEGVPLLRSTANPIKSSEPLWDLRYPPPLPGQHTEEILHELVGLSHEEIAELRDRKVIG